ncbi:DUF1559 domain-containing protein [bacterium]|nr:MAG: DUF1559 domain-containing protein [bacterium]
MSFNNSQCRSSKAGFTLIEILIVIAIIGLLAAILFPVFARARESARRASCQSNLKQIGIALLQYTQDYDETFPCFYALAYSAGITHNTWRALQPYSKSQQIFYCPSTTTYTNCYQDTECTDTGKEITYGFNAGPVWQQESGSVLGGLYREVDYQSQDGAQFITIKGTHQAHIASPSTMFMASDAYDTWVNSMDLTSAWQDDIPTTNSAWRHGNLRSVLFADGHVKSLQWRAGNYTPNFNYWSETLMLPANSANYESYCADPNEKISFPLQSVPVRCGDIPPIMATNVTHWH